jgi:hypothetical protein
VNSLKRQIIKKKVGETVGTLYCVNVGVTVARVAPFEALVSVRRNAAREPRGEKNRDRRIVELFYRKYSYTHREFVVEALLFC